jgi:uncharacterized protein (DUF3820 family)
MKNEVTARMPFGKYKDKPINEIDPTYLEWVLANCQQIYPDLKRAICATLGLEVTDDPKDKEIADLQAAMTELRQKNLVSRLEAYDQGYQDGKSEHIDNEVKEWHQSLVQEYQGSPEAMKVVRDAYDRLQKGLESKIGEFIESDQEWITLEDYCLEREVLLDHSQLISEGLAISRHLRTSGLQPPHKLRHDRYGTVNGYRRCTLDQWYEQFPARRDAESAPTPLSKTTTRRPSRSRTPKLRLFDAQVRSSPN